ncbi:MAG: hypothetical protein WA197_18645 [Candidatus Acidiferrales bacterium]
MLSTRIPTIRSQTLIGLGVLLFGLLAAWEIGGWIAAEDLTPIAFVAMGIAGFAVALTILRDWRLGFYFFLVWLLFEDLMRKFLGNNMVIYFAKDILVGLVYVSLYIAIRRGRAKTFRPPFLLPLSLLIWLGVIQILNFNSPHILYGLIGFKLYFYYIPLMFVGYALIRSDEDLRKFLVANGVLACVISVIGIVQAIVGNSFLNPTTLAPELRELGNLEKVTPLSNQVFSLPDSVFVSSGRFSLFLVLAAILTMSSAGYLLLYTKRSRGIIYLAFALVGVATLLSGSRGAVVIAMATALILSVGFLWGAPWRQRQAHRLVKTIRRSAMVACLGLAALLLLFPNEAGSRIAFYTETLSPNSSEYAVSYRSWDYPIQNLELAFTNPNWLLGNGIGTGSLGTQYVARAIGQIAPNIFVEEGFGTMIIEMGILAPFLWILCSAALLLSCWRVVRRLRQTRFCPIGVAVLWYAFLLLIPLTFGSLNSYLNYINNVYLWLMVGVLFRLPTLLPSPSPHPVGPSP